MLIEPDRDAARDALDQALIAAARARIAAGARTTPDADAIALREQLAGVGPDEVPLLRALLGRLEAATAPPLTIWGGVARTLAADRFGLSARLATDPEAALTAVRNGHRALIDLTGDRPWWGRLLAQPELRVTAALPDDRHGRPLTLMIDRRPSGPTGDDRTFWVSDSGQGDAKIVTALGQAGLAATPLIAAGGLKLFILAGYVQADDSRLNGAPGTLAGIIGAAPVF